MNMIKTVQSVIPTILIILLTEGCYSNEENNVQFVLSEKSNVQFVKRLQSDFTLKPNIPNFWELDNPTDIQEAKDGTIQKKSPISKYFETKGDNTSKNLINRRVSRQVNNGYTSIYPSLSAFNPNAYNMYPTPYQAPGPGPQYSGSLPPPNAYNYPSNVNSFNNLNRYPQNYTFQASVPKFNYSSRTTYYPQGPNSLTNYSTVPTYNQNNPYNPSYNSNQNYYNNFHNYPYYPNTTNSNSQRTSNPIYNSAQAINGSSNSQPYWSPNFSTYNTSSNKGIISNGSPSYPTYRPKTINQNFGSNNSKVLNNSQNAFNPYHTPKPLISNQKYPVNPTYYTNNSNYRNQQIYSQNNYFNNPQNSSYFTYNKDQFNKSGVGITLNRPYQNNLIYNTTNPPNNLYNYNTPFNQPFYTQTTPTPMPFRPNTRPQNNFFGSNQSNWIEPNHFYYTPGVNKLTNTTKYNLPHKYFK